MAVRPVALADSIGQPWSHEDSVGDGRLGHIARIVFAKNDGQARAHRIDHLLMHLSCSPANHLRSWNCFVCSKDVFGRVVAVNVGGNEVEGNFVFDTVADKSINPGCLRRGRSPDPEPRVDRLQSSSRCIVQLIISLFLWIARPEIKVGLVPHLEIPLGDLRDAVTIDQMLRKLSNQRRPFGPVPGRRNNGLVPEGLLDFLRGKLSRHEAQLDKRANAVLQQSVIYLVDVGEIVNGAALTIFVIETDLIVKNGMEADIFKAGLLASLRASRDDSSRAAREWLRPDPNICSQKCGKADARGR